MSIFQNARDRRKQDRNAQPTARRSAASQERMASLHEMMSTQTRAAYAAAEAAVGLAERSGLRRTVTIAGMRQIAMVNFDLLMEFELTVLPDGIPPYPAMTRQLVSPRQARRLAPGLVVNASVDPSDPAVIRLHLESLS
jgi:hypothetical protein